MLCRGWARGQDREWTSKGNEVFLESARYAHLDFDGFMGVCVYRSNIKFYTLNICCLSHVYYTSIKFFFLAKKWIGGKPTTILFHCDCYCLKAKLLCQTLSCECGYFQSI